MKAFLSCGLASLLVYACGLPGNEIAEGGGEVRETADAVAATTSYRLRLDKIADIAVGEKFYVTALIEDCAGRVTDGDVAVAEVTLDIVDGDDVRQLAVVKANEGVAHFYVLMKKVGRNYLLRAEALLAGEKVITESGPFNAFANLASGDVPDTGDGEQQAEDSDTAPNTAVETTEQQASTQEKTSSG